MEKYQTEIIETLIIAVIFFVSVVLLRTVFERLGKKIQITRKRIVKLKRLSTYLLLIISVVICGIIWGVDQKELFLFISSFLTILGIAFFAQWSLLSNITASIILFVTHPVKAEDKVQILDKDFSFTGVIEDIGLFFITIRCENQEIVTIPTSVLLQKPVKVLGDETTL